MFLVLGALGVLLLLVALVLGDVLDGALEGLSAGYFSTEALAGFLGALGLPPFRLAPGLLEPLLLQTVCLAPFRSEPVGGLARGME